MSETKTRFIPAFVMTVVAAAAALYFLPQLFSPDKSESRRAVVVTVTFVPDERSRVPKPGQQMSEVVAIRITIGTNFGKPEYATASPWVQPLYPIKGEKVVVVAEQVHGVSVTCQITQGPVRGKPLTRTGPGAVTCAHVTQ